MAVRIKPKMSEKKHFIPVKTGIQLYFYYSRRPHRAHGLNSSINFF